jgi:hypothetical protein
MKPRMTTNEPVCRIGEHHAGDELFRLRTMVLKEIRQLVNDKRKSVPQKLTAPIMPRTTVVLMNTQARVFPSEPQSVVRRFLLRLRMSFVFALRVDDEGMNRAFVVMNVGAWGSRKSWAGLCEGCPSGEVRPGHKAAAASARSSRAGSHGRHPARQRQPGALQPTQRETRPAITHHSQHGSQYGL